jgi:hypoxanthine-guanine phosphoribosyltransferase
VIVRPNNVLISRVEYLEIVDEMAQSIKARVGSDAVGVLIAMKGAGYLASDLIPALQRADVDVVAIRPERFASYHGGTSSTGTVTRSAVTEDDSKHLDLSRVDVTKVRVGQVDMTGITTLFIDDCIDSIGTVRAVRPMIERGDFCDPYVDWEPDMRGLPSQTLVAVLYAKEKAMAMASLEPGLVDVVGRVIPDVFVVGQGLDYDQKFRELPDLWDVEVIDNSEPELSVVPVLTEVYSHEGASLEL